MGSYTLTWRGPAFLAQARAGAVRGLTDLDLRGEAEAKAELYPGHGLLTGTLRRGIVGEPAQAVSPTLVRGRIAVKGIPYARRIERRYGYLTKGWGRVRPRAREIISQHIREAIGG